MSSENMTDREKRNIEMVHKWAKAWSEDVGRMVDESYAETADVFTPIQGIHWSRRGKSKADWRFAEVDYEKKFSKREMRLAKVFAQGDTVAIEMQTTTTNKKGDKTRNGWFAAFLTFNDEGKIIEDHTYQVGPSPIGIQYPPDLQEVMNRIIADNRVGAMLY
jgi:hypothetical protein